MRIRISAKGDPGVVRLGHKTSAVAVGVGLVAALLALPLGTSRPSAEERGPSSAFTKFAVPEAKCRAEDRVETGLQGQVPVADRLTGRATEGYNCNLDLIGSHASTAWSNFDTYKDCAYYGDLRGFGGEGGGTVVLDVSNPAKPRQTDYLTTPAMQAPGESLRVNHRRGLLVADQYDGGPNLDVYDVSKDCRHPKLLFSDPVGTARGHEGWFQPDGMVYYMTNPGSRSQTQNDPARQVFPIDLSNPKKPRQMAEWPLHGGGAHGGSVSDDGTRAYICEIGFYGEEESVVIADTSRVQAGDPSPKQKVISVVPLPGNFMCQATYPVTYDGDPYLIQFGENSLNRCPPWIPGLVAFKVLFQADQPPGDPTAPVFAYPRIFDIRNEKKPKEVGKLLLEVDDPLNCPLLMGDLSPQSVGGGGVFFGYDVHHCSPDRLHDPTILACANFMSGLRVFDIRNPRKPKELAYYNTGTVSVTDHAVDAAVSRPVVRTDLRQIWFTTEFRGFHVAQFAPGVWPFKKTPKCPPRKDYYFEQYNPRTKC